MSNINYKYLPPAKKQQAQQQRQTKLPYSHDSFPELNNNNNNNNDKTQIARSPFSFAAVTEKYKPKEEEKAETAVDKDKLTPGWAYIRRNTGNKIEYKYGPESEHYKAYLNEGARARVKQDAVYFKKLVEWWQWHRDEQNRLLGDCSPYYGTKTLMELYEVDTADDRGSQRKSWAQEDKQDFADPLFYTNNVDYNIKLY